MHIIPLSLLSCYNDGKGGDDLRVIFKALIVVVIILAFPLSIVCLLYTSFQEPEYEHSKYSFEESNQDTVSYTHLDVYKRQLESW